MSLSGNISAAARKLAYWFGTNQNILLEIDGRTAPSSAASLGSPSRHSTASAPGPGAGSISSSSNTCVTALTQPSLVRPAWPSTTPSSSPSPTLPSRVSALPRIGTQRRSPRRRSSCAARRGEPVPILAPAGRSARSATTSTMPSSPSAASSSAGDDCAPHSVRSHKCRRAPEEMVCSMHQNALVAVGPAQPYSRDLSTSNSQPGADGSKPCPTSQRATSRLRNDHHARITSRSMSVP